MVRNEKLRQFHFQLNEKFVFWSAQTARALGSFESGHVFHGGVSQTWVRILAQRSGIWVTLPMSVFLSKL